MSLPRAIVLVLLVASVSVFAVCGALAVAPDFSTLAVLLAVTVCTCGVLVEVGMR